MSLVPRAMGLLAFVIPIFADVKLPAILSDHMVIQQQMPVRVWGKAAAREKVTVAFNQLQFSTTADATGAWQVFLPPMPAGGPFDLDVRAANHLTLHDVLVGEVWLGSGQSNMEHPLTMLKNATAEIAAAGFPQIRFFTVKRNVSETPLADLAGAWKVCTPETASEFSALGYFFSRELHRARRVPVGFIHSSLGGSPIQSWLSHPALQANPLINFTLHDWDQVLAAYPAAAEKYRAEQAKSAANPPQPPDGPGSTNAPASLYNAMLAPLTPYAIRGVLWYQGETNANYKFGIPYRFFLRTLIEDWRHAWGQGDFPFLVVQLPNFESNGVWPLIRESQAGALALRNTALAVTYDIGESTDIHPHNKPEVAHRLALAAQAIAYGEPIEYSGPAFRQMTREANALRLYFDHVGIGLQARGGALTGFEIAAQTGNFIPAEASLDGATVLVHATQLADPKRVRYAWADDPKATLQNREGLPATPFRAELR